MREDQTVIDERIDHDVNVVAAVLTLRAGRITYSLDDARAVFATTTSLVVKNVTKWYTAQGMDGVSPVIHQIGLSNVAWLKNPGGAASRLKRHELVASCAAALRPTPQMWRRFTDELRQLQNCGGLTSDEEIAVLTSRLVDTRLAEIEDEEDVDAETVVDIVERDHVRLRRLWNVGEQFHLAATAQNLKRLVQFLARGQPVPTLATSSGR